MRFEIHSFCLRALTVLMFGAISATAVAQDEQPKTTIEIGSRLELLLDDFLIDSIDNLSFQMHRPRRAEKVLVPQVPWEGRSLGHVTVFQDGDLYRMYYRGYIKPPGFSWEKDQVMCYAESRDGIHWSKPSLGLVEWQGSKANNILWHGAEAAAMAPFRDARPEVPEDERYKSLGGNPPYAMVSPDGIHWRRMQEQPVLPKPRFGVSFWDAGRKQYLAYVRSRQDGFRSIALCTSQDFLNWSSPKNLDFGDSPVEHLYWNTASRYFRAPHLYLGFPMRLTERSVEGVEKKQDRTDAAFVFSRDGLHFSRRYMEAFLRPGRDARNWRSHCNMMALGIVPTAEDEISLYYTDNFELPTIHLRRLVLRTDGFVSLRAPYSGGEFTTRPLIFSGDRLVLNVATSSAGGLRAEIQDAEGKPLDGYALEDCPEFYGDRIDHAMRWNRGHDLSALAGKAIRLRFVMRDADLYSLRFAAGEKQTP